jgi:hypothetical protein
MLNGIYKYQTGQPFSVTYSRSFGSSSNIATLRADHTAGMPLWISGTGGGRRVVNLSAFTIPAACLASLDPAQCTNGNTGRNQFRMDSFWQPDLALNRSLYSSDRMKVTFRGEVFNVVNHPNWSVPQTTSIATVYQSTPSSALVVSYVGSVKSSSLYAQGVTGGLSSIFQSGGPRSMQFSLKVAY